MEPNRNRTTKYRMLWFLVGICGLIISAAAVFSYPLPGKAHHTAAGSEFSGGLTIDLNTADPETLSLLPGVGENRANAIVEYRTAHGGIEYPGELLIIPGITAEVIASWDGMLAKP